MAVVVDGGSQDEIREDKIIDSISKHTVGMTLP